MRAFLGMGLLGSNFAKALLKKGEAVQVWNRTTSRATALEADGAKAFANVADAVKGADIIHITVKDDASVDEVLAQAAAGFQPGATIIDHTTTSKQGAIERTAAWKAKGYTYLHAPVFMGPSNALDSSGFMLVSGDQAVVEKYTPVLESMTGKLLNFGPNEGQAAAIKLMGNCFLVAFTVGLSDTLALAKSLDLPQSDVTKLFEMWNPAGMLHGRMKRMTAGTYDQPSWELNMARKDTQLFLDQAASTGTTLTAIPAIAETMDQWIAKGVGGKDWTVISSENIPKP
ncbi:NAD(P)-dependent oxidoreductase [Paraflavitalea pollutisoli]|uniref:NAD(P)-dependent oxidoreductase n=1 Tax=Paraflavitalea pollutisoli TaxID=3034143 RepID=UPI0023EBFCA6|nr:NAD(P)-dependent oxidoreductase [Paraflavitalea sp. H1-2-19X]